MAKTLIAYFSHAGQNYSHGSIRNLNVGNTEVVAKKIHTLVDSDLFYIDTIRKYPDDHMKKIEIAKREYNEMLQIGIPAFRIIGITLIISGMTIMMSGVFQAMNQSGKALAVSIVQAATLVGSAALLALTGSVRLVWWAFPIGDRDLRPQQRLPFQDLSACFVRR